MHNGKTKIIINPIASGGKAIKLWPQLQQLFIESGLQFDAEITQRPGHATQIARDALEAGFRDFVTLGGDGTVNETVDGLIAAGQPHPEVTLSIVPSGTGCDFARYIGIPRDPLEAVNSVLGQRTRRVDVGEIACMREGKPIRRCFVNVAGLGFDSEVCVRVNRMSKRISGTIPYLTSLVLTLFSYANKDVTLTYDGQSRSGRYNSVVICNGQYFGGGMWIGPKAAADDGIFDVVILGDLNKLEFLVNVPRVYKGTHLSHPKIATFQARQVHVEAKQRMFIQAEGELVGEAPATFSVIPGALSIRV